MNYRSFKIILPIIIPLIIIFLPSNSFGLEGLTVLQQRTIAIFILAALCWILEPIPIYATSVVVIVLELFLLSDKSFIWLRQVNNPETFGSLIPSAQIMSTFANPIIMLFLGGFFLAMAATKYRLDLNLARILLKPFGQSPKYVILGLMLITGFFSMFMSNTATTAMMLAILAPIILLFEQGDPGRIALVLSIPTAANIGGIGTPIGTPPNAIALKYLTGEHSISFVKWMLFGLPYALIILIFAWFLLYKFYPPKLNKIALNIDATFSKKPKAIVVYVIFTATILLWLLEPLHGMDSYTVAMIPVAVFSLTGIINKNDLKTISWDVLWLVAGGIALGLALEKTKLAVLIINSIPFDHFSPFLIILGASFLCLIMANFMSHTATSNLLLPLMAVLATAVPSLASFGGSTTLILSTTIASSLGMALPISTPPNALAHATGYVESSQMIKTGVIIGIVGVLISFPMLYFLSYIKFI